MNCAMCGQKIPNLDTSVCDQCRADAALGMAVRAMPEYCDLYRLKNTWEVSRQFGGPRGFGETPEDALRRARLMKEAENDRQN